MADPLDPQSVDRQYEEDRAHGEQAYQEHEINLERFDVILGRIEAIVSPGRFLDVGCSLGTSLVAARKRGWEVKGIELSRPVASGGGKISIWTSAPCISRRPGSRRAASMPSS